MVNNYRFEYNINLETIILLYIVLYFQTKDREVDFDVEIAIKVCRQASPEDALLLAQKHGRHECYLRIQIEDKQEYKKALEYIATLEFEEVRFMI